MENPGYFSIERNNLDKSSSPYLLQHTQNPVWWQEWSEELIKYAVKIRKPILVSVGYSTCHWCHVMAAEAFSDKETAAYLNEHFICIKVDREQRPDIDQFMMDFINQQNGRGGWPLNVFLTPSLHPVFALTYAPMHSSSSMLSFLAIAEKVYEYFLQNTDKIPPFISVENQPPFAEEHTIIDKLAEYYDRENGGFGRGQKFPTHSTILYLLYALTNNDNPLVKEICIKTLDSISLKGINDHLQGGIFRYCIDSEWTIPHFEKMLYDQAMALWVFALAYRVIGNEEYKNMADRILRCLEQSFKADGLYISAHDADTEHMEGATYLWSYKQLVSELTPEEFDRFSSVYNISKAGNFDGFNHLVKRNNVRVTDIEDKLLSVRNARKQPARDDKILCGMNALVAIGMIQAGRLLGRPSLENEAKDLVNNVVARFWDGKTLSHSFYNGIISRQNFLFDGATLLLAVSMLLENDSSWKDLIDELSQYIGSFKENEIWTESKATDFKKVCASWFDHPIPSSVSLTEMGLRRAALISGHVLKTSEYRQPFQSDFYNLSAMISNGLFHVYTSLKFIDWSKLPANSLQLRGEHEQDCYGGVCRPIRGNG